jgi:hypothetical protein
MNTTNALQIKVAVLPQVLDRSITTIDEPMDPNLVASIECQEKCSDSRSVVICHNIPFNLVLSCLMENIIKNTTNWVMSSWKCGEDQLS